MAMQVKVGSFASATATGAQAITGVGFTPKAIIFFGSGATANGFRTSYYASIGMTSGATESYSVGIGSANGVSPSDSSRRMALKAFTLVAEGEVLVRECDLTSFGADGFTLNWTTANATGHIVNFIALGGTDITNAKVVEHTSATVVGDKAVTGVGFKPDCVLHSWVGDLPTAGALPKTATQAYLSFGVMDKEGNQWVSGLHSLDGSASADTVRFSHTDRCLGKIYAPDQVQYQWASFKSMDSDGFTLYHGAVDNARHIISLCLKGGSYRVGNFLERGAGQTGKQRLDGLGFRPKGLMFSGARYIGNNYSQATLNHWGLSATSGPTNSKAIAVYDNDGVNPSQVGAYQEDKAIVAITGASASAVSDLDSLDDDGFTLNWTSAINFDDHGILFLAFGDTPASSSRGMSIKVGSFTKSAATGTQAITGVGFQPKALILYTTGTNTATGFANSPRSALGFTSGVSESYSVCAASLNAVSPSNTSRRMAAKALTLVDWGEALRAECDLASFDSDGFTLNWTTNDTSAFIINYIALGGDDLVSAKVVQWSTRVGPGNHSITGVGFKPDCVLHATVWETNVLPFSIAHAKLSFGAMDRHGNQWTNNFHSKDASNPSDTQRSQFVDNCLWNVNAFETRDDSAKFLSMDSDGFTVYSDTGVAHKITSLCLKGGSYKVGSFSHKTSPGYQSVGSVGFRPKGLLTSNKGGGSSSSPNTFSLWGLGASSGANFSKSISLHDDNNIATTSAQGYQADVVAVDVNDGTSSLRNSASLVSFDSNGFTLNWAQSSGPTYEYLYLAFGDTVAEDATLDSGTKVKVGSFAKSTATGLQQINGINFRPKALIFYTVASSVTGWADAWPRPSLGFSAGGGKSFSVSTAMVPGVSPADTSRRMAAKALTMVQPDTQATQNEADLASFDADGFTLNWTTNDGVARLINYVAIGGRDLIGANVIQWTPAGGSGNKTVVGVGFQPDSVLHMSDADNSALPASSGSSILSFGAMDKDGGQWANSIASDDGVNPSNTMRAQLTNACFLRTYGTIQEQASFVSMDADGFTINFSAAAALPYKISSLCLKGPRIKVGSYVAPSATGSHAVTGVGFTPKGFLTSSINQASGTVFPDIAWGLAATSGASSSRAIAVRDRDNVSTSDAQGYQGDYGIVGLNPSTASDTDLIANLTAFNPDGATFNWTDRSSGAGTIDILYLAIGDTMRRHVGWGMPAGS